MAVEHEVVVKPDIVFAEHDGVRRLGDFYLPKGSGKAPVLVGVHGDGWQLGDRKFYRHWGIYLAKYGYAVFAIEYRHETGCKDLAGGGRRSQGGGAVCAPALAISTSTRRALE